MTTSGHGIDNDDLFMKFGSAKLIKKNWTYELSFGFNY